MIYSLGVSEGVTVLYYYLLLSISPFKSSNIHFIYLGAPLLGAYTFINVIYFYGLTPLSLSIFKSILSDMSIATSPFFLFPFA